MAGETQFVLAASSTTVISHAATLTNNSYTYSGLTGLTMTDLDNSTDKYPHLRAVLSVPDTFSAAPSAGGYVGLYMLKLNVDSTSDEVPAPDSTALKAAQWIGSFPIQAYDVAALVAIDVPNVLRGVTGAQFFIENKSGVSGSYSSNPITVKVTPYTFKPA
jgi:hypothetical protein